MTQLEGQRFLDAMSDPHFAGLTVNRDKGAITIPRTKLGHYAKLTAQRVKGQSEVSKLEKRLENVGSDEHERKLRLGNLLKLAKDELLNTDAALMNECSVLGIPAHTKVRGPSVESRVRKIAERQSRKSLEEWQ